jgi:hypothetical protein
LPQKIKKHQLICHVIDREVWQGAMAYIAVTKLWPILKLIHSVYTATIAAFFFPRKLIDQGLVYFLCNKL